MLDTKKVLFNSIIPPNKDESLPGLGDLDFYKYIKESSKESLLDKIILILEAKSEELFSSNLKDLGESDFKKILKSSISKNFRDFNSLALLGCDYYYTNVTVREKLKLTIKPPFPDGNFVKEVDFSVLEQVYNKGKIYR